MFLRDGVFPVLLLFSKMLMFVLRIVQAACTSCEQVVALGSAFSVCDMALSGSILVGANLSSVLMYLVRETFSLVHPHAFDIDRFTISMLLYAILTAP